MKQRGPLPDGAKESDIWLVALYDFVVIFAVLLATIALIFEGVNTLSVALTLLAQVAQVLSQARMNKILGRRSEK